MEPKDFRNEYICEWPVDPERGSGRTRRQLLRLGQKGMYVIKGWKEETYTINLARFLGREDIVVVPWASIRYAPQRMMHYAVNHIDIDFDHHLFEDIEPAQGRKIAEYLSMIRSRFPEASVLKSPSEFLAPRR